MLKNITNTLQRSYFAIIVIMLITLQSCDLIGGIFEAGMWTGVIIIVLVVLLIIYIISRFRK